MIIYTWKIEELEWMHRSSGLAKVVSTVKGKCEATQDDHMCWIPFVANLAAPEADSMIAYDALTESQVVEWVKTALGAEKVASIESSLATLVEEDLDGGKPQKHISQPPW
tara:strand:- start:8 stop:337 length:330 start_codon:yes stop_codon:yes gene_type:complete